MVLVAILPPDHVQERALRAQDDLFRRYGIASTRALPPLVAVGIEGASSSDGLTADTTVRPGTRARSPIARISGEWVLSAYRIGPATVQSGRIIAETTLAEASRHLASSLQLMSPDAGVGRIGFPLGALYLGERDRTTDDRLPELPLGPEPLFPDEIGSASIVRLEVESDQAAADWWCSMRWTMLESRRVRVPRD